MGLAIEGQARPTDAFLKLSSQLTGFPVSELDPELGLLYRALVDSADSPSLEALLQGEDSSERERVERQIIELWYSGILPTDTGSKVVAFQNSLGWRALDFCAPPSYCGPAWWK